jgi:type IV pilus assembly protein PilA
MRTKQKGFSLIELLIVVAIILIIAAIAIPNLLRSKMAANEASAVASLRTLNTSSVAYSTTYGSYPTSLTQFAPATTPSSTAADLVDSVLATGTKSGYTFSFSGNGTQYVINADPVSVSTGQRHFFTDQTLVIRANTSVTATANDTPIG